MQKENQQKKTILYLQRNQNYYPLIKIKCL